jgi:hypothetical protein
MLVFEHPCSRVKLLIFAVCMVLAVFLLEGKIGFNLADEGYLWYGAQRVFVGEVPIRDFMSYDPGRYYWSAGFMRLWHDNGIMVLRASVAVFQTIGLYVGLCLIASSLPNAKSRHQNRVYLFLSAIVLLAWMCPRHKLFDISLSIFLVGLLTLLIQKPTQTRYFLTGLCVGLVAVFGRNHGVYGLVGSLGVMLWLHFKRVEGPGWIKSVSWWVMGAWLGFAPIVVMMLIVPGFAKAFFDSILFLFEAKATNLPLPIPWPWRVEVAAMTHRAVIQYVLVGVFYIGLIVFSTVSIVYALWCKFQRKSISPVLVACAFLALPYAHYAYSRADVGHLALSIFPLLIGVLVLLASQSTMLKWSGSLLFAIVSLWVMLPEHPAWECYQHQCRRVEVGHSILRVPLRLADEIHLFHYLADTYARHQQSFLIETHLAGVYALLERQSPRLDISALSPCPTDFELREIARLQKAQPQFAVVNNTPFDGDANRCFQKVHPLIYDYIQQHFERLPDAANIPLELYKVKPAS